MENAIEPRLDLAKRVLPNGLLQALILIAERSSSAMMLVGGTALAGFYAGHRRSDDLDLFCKDDFSFESTWRAVDLLEKKGAVIASRQASNTYQRRVLHFLGHTFTVDVVLDSNIFKVGERLLADTNLGVASLKTLLKMKSATLVSRAGEKDLYDLLWLFSHFKEVSLEQFLSFGTEIDGGMNAEAVLYALGATNLTVDSCGFVLPAFDSPESAFSKIVSLKKQLEKDISVLLHHKKSESTIGELVKLVKRIEK